MRRILILIGVLLFAATIHAQTGAYYNHCALGGIPATVQGLPSVNYLNGIIPACTVTVYFTGTTTVATNLTDLSGNPISGILTGNTSISLDPGGFAFRAPTNQGYDIQLSGGNSNPACNTGPLCYHQPVIIPDQFVQGSFLPGTGVSSINTVQGAFTFTGNVSCVGTTCNFGNGTTFQHNSTNLPSQTLLNFFDTPANLTPAALDANNQPVVFKNDTHGGLAAETAATATQLSAYLIPPTTGQFVPLCAGTFGGTVTDSNAAFGAAACGGSGTAKGIIAGAPHTATVTWSNYSLPSYVSPGSVSAVYIVLQEQSQKNGIGSWTFTCNVQSIGTTSVTQTSQFSALLTGVTGSNIGSLSCTLSVSASGFTGTDFTLVAVPIFEVFVYYTGTPPPAVNQTNIQLPLHWDSINDILSLDIPPDTGVDSGTANNYQVAMASKPQYIPGLTVKFLAGNASTSTTPSLSVNGSTAGTIVGPRGGALVSGDISTSVVAEVILQTTGGTPTWALQNPQVSSTAPVQSVSNSDGTLTCTPTTGNVVCSTALGHANTWTAKQSQPKPILTDATGLGAASCLYVDNSGQVTPNSGVACGPGASGVSDGSGTTTANQMAVSTAVSHAITYKDFPEHLIIPAANCNNATAGAGWSIPASNAPTVACRAGTNNLGGVLQWANNNTTTNAQFTIQLPFDWDTTVQPWINIIYGSGANTSGTVKWTFSSACTKSDGSVTDDPSFNAESATSGKTMAVANRMWAESLQFTAVTSGNNCIAGSTVIVKVTSGNGTATSTVNVEQVTITIPRQIVDQAN